MDEYVKLEEYNRRHSDLVDLLRSVDNKVDETNNRLFKDNGKKSHQTIINEHEKVIKVIIWAVAVTATSSIAGLIGIVCFLIQQHMTLPM